MPPSDPVRRTPARYRQYSSHQAPSRSRIEENFDIFDVELTGDELAAIDGLDTGVRGGPPPEAVTRETFGLEIPEA